MVTWGHLGSVIVSLNEVFGFMFESWHLTLIAVSSCHAPEAAQCTSDPVKHVHMLDILPISLLADAAGVLNDSSHIAWQSSDCLTISLFHSFFKKQVDVVVVQCSVHWRR